MGKYMIEGTSESGSLREFGMEQMFENRERLW